MLCTTNKNNYNDQSIFTVENKAGNWQDAKIVANTGNIFKLPGGKKKIPVFHNRVQEAYT